MAKTPSITAGDPQQGIVAVDAAHAPVVYFDGAPTFAANNGIVSITLATVRYIPGGADVSADIVVSAHLKCSVAAAIDLKNAIDKALLLAVPASPTQN